LKKMVAGREREVTSEDIKGFLERYSQVTGEEYLAEENERVEAVMRTCHDEAMKLLAKAREEKAGIQKLRIDAENELFGLLGNWITVEIAPPDLFEHPVGLTFGIGRENALKLLEFALKKEVDVGIFFRYCDGTRKVLQGGSVINFFRENFGEDLTDLGEVIPYYHNATLNLFDYFSGRGERLGMARYFFKLAKEKLDAINQEDIKADLKAMSTHFEFMTTDGIEVFRDATDRKRQYETLVPAEMP